MGEYPRHAGELLRYWRKRRGLSQLALGLSAGVSTRHLSYVETGRAQPSRELLLLLARNLRLPRHERSAVLAAAGYSAKPAGGPLDAPELTSMRHAVELLLRQSEPFPALVVDHRWEVTMVNAAFARLHAMLASNDLVAYQLLPAPRPNLIERLFDPSGIRAHLRNFDAVASAFLDRLMRDRARSPAIDPLLERVRRFPGVVGLERAPDRGHPGAILVPLEIVVGRSVLSLVTTVTTLGTQSDQALAELHIESLLPADRATEDLLRALARQ